jgi:hypothetical protein
MPKGKRFMSEAELKRLDKRRRQDKANYNRSYNHDYAAVRRDRRQAARWRELVIFLLLLAIAGAVVVLLVWPAGA